MYSVHMDGVYRYPTCVSLCVCLTQCHSMVNWSHVDVVDIMHCLWIVLQVKKMYRKACLSVHPDKVKQLFYFQFHTTVECWGYRYNKRVTVVENTQI